MRTDGSGTRWNSRSSCDLSASNSASACANAARVPGVSRHEVNPDSTEAARLSRLLDFTREDRADFALFNRILWQAIKGDRLFVVFLRQFVRRM